MFKKAKKEKIFDDVLEQIIENIKSGALKPGDALPTERNMAEMLGVSRPLLREVLKSLELLGVITSVHGGGNYISLHLESCLIRPLSILFALNNSSVRQSQQLRSALECEAAFLAAQNCTSLQAAELNLLIEKLTVSKEEKEMERFDRDLHLAIAKMADNPLIYSILSASALITDTIIAGIRNFVDKEYQSYQNVERQHREIVGCISRKDADGARRAMKAHMDAIEGYILKIQG